MVWSTGVDDTRSPRHLDPPLLCRPLRSIAPQSHLSGNFSNDQNDDDIEISIYTDKKENLFFFIYKEILSGAVAKSYMRKGFLIYEIMRKYFPIDEEAVSHI